MKEHVQINRKNPTAFLFVVDQSLSMGYVMPSVNKPKAKHVADVINRTILSLIDLCNKADGVRDYFYIGIIGYNGRGVKNALFDEQDRDILNSVSQVADNVKKIEYIIEKVDNGFGKIVEKRIEFPVWMEPDADGETPMCEAFELAKKTLEEWCKNNPNSYPPTLIHVTDGDSTDGNPEEIAENIKKLCTLHGDTLIFNLHVSSFDANTIEYPFSDNNITDEYAKMLFKMSSIFPEHLIGKANDRGYRVVNNSRGFIFNADAVDVVNFLEIGTLPTDPFKRR
ncbi:MAG: hypothetical protein LBF13_03825 [Campylobacteraceae bacterium]|jgi:hypothetical protein|nr:hypothetical protein [Campylobacteraceae bacterium]